MTRGIDEDMEAIKPNMLLVAVVAGAVAFNVVGSIVGLLATHNANAGLVPGIVAAIWAACPFIYKGKLQRYNLMHPVPKSYKVQLKQAFSKVRQILDEKTYNFGDGWKVTTADTQARRIHAILKWTDEETNLEPQYGGIVNTRVVRVQRIIVMDIQMKELPNDSTAVQFDFFPRIEGSKFTAGDQIISELQNDVELVLGTGTKIGNEFIASLPAPPYWLLGLTALALFGLLNDVMAAVFK